MGGDWEERAALVPREGMHCVHLRLAGGANPGSPTSIGSVCASASAAWGFFLESLVCALWQPSCGASACPQRPHLGPSALGWQDPTCLEAEASSLAPGAVTVHLLPAGPTLLGTP